jgi:hypothetical protein
LSLHSVLQKSDVTASGDAEAVVTRNWTRLAFTGYNHGDWWLAENEQR